MGSADESFSNTKSGVGLLAQRASHVRGRAAVPRVRESGPTPGSVDHRGHGFCET